MIKSQVTAIFLFALAACSDSPHAAEASRGTATRPSTQTASDPGERASVAAQDSSSEQIVEGGEAQPDHLSDLGFEIVKETSFGQRKTIYIEIPDQVSELEIQSVAAQLRRENAGFKKLFLFYLLPDMVVGEGAWATSHYSPELEIKIVGISEEVEQEFNSSSDVPEGLVGKWYDNTPYIESALTIYTEGGALLLKTQYKDGSGSVKSLKESDLGGRRKFVYENSAGEYLLILEGGDLGIYDRAGYIATAKRVD